MTREELIDYLKGLYKNTDFCTVCQKYGLYCDENCVMKDAIAWLSRPLKDRLIEVLREVRGEE